MSNQIVEITGSEIQDFLIQQLKDQNNHFVFSTDVVMNSWIDFLVTNPDLSGVSALPLERFTAWDKFKNTSLHATQKGKSAIPSDLRKIYISSLIESNAENPFFKRIINPDFAKNASSFTDWLSKLLPSLKLWYTLKEQKGTAYDAEDEDYKTLYEKYSAFLESNSMFEPSWLDAEFTGNEKYIILFPELLEDFYDYEDVLLKSSNITLVKLKTEEISNNRKINCYKYTDSRKELRRTILQIRKLVQDKKAEYTDITLNVPNLETYRPYLERELTKYCVPFVIKAGTPLTKNSAGKIFTEIQDCYTSNFSYESVRALLLDEYIPWKESENKTRESLIQEGNRMHCLFNYEDKDGKKIDVWDQALSHSVSIPDVLEEKFYSSLKKRITELCTADSFSKILQQWIIFRDDFLCMDDFTLESNNIIARCIVHLNELIQIEEKFSEPNSLKVPNPYSFFLNKINKSTYTPQTKKTGLSVYPYKLSAAACFKYQFVIDANQNNIELPVKELAFLNSIKRAELGLIETDKKYNASRTLIALYAKGQDKSVITFSYAEESFGGFAIVHNFLSPILNSNGEPEDNPLWELDKDDFILNEEKLFFEKPGEAPAKPNFFSEAQKTQFNEWYTKNQKRLLNPMEESELNEDAKNLIKKYLVDGRNKKEKPELLNKIVITQSDLKAFFNCPRYWLFSKALNLKEDSLDASLIDFFDIGNINHKVLELFLKHYMELKQKLPCSNEKGEFENNDEIFSRILDFTDKAIKDPELELKESPLTLTMLQSQKQAIAQNIMNFVKLFLKETPEDSSKTSGFGKHYVVEVESHKNYADKKEEWAYYGKIDCILSKDSPDGEIKTYALIDFKTSTVPTATSCIVNSDDELFDFQIPTYITLINNGTEKEYSFAGFAPIKIETGKDEVKFTAILDEKNTKKDKASFDPTMKKFHEVSKVFNDKIKQENFDPADANVTEYEDCIKCSYKPMCRFTFTVAGRDMKKGE
ncbi:MAG: PD-(D/E)XK nuclease family protein [Treponema sp.]|nr:PD-(D/E)XK nuclease family protein [Treponema sp.]